MEAIIIAGGRGRRMGALTANRQKGCLKYRGTPIIWHILRTLVLPEISTIRFATGYRADDVHRVLTEATYREGFPLSIVEVDTVGMYGEFTKLAYVMRQLPKNADCLFTGVDTIFPGETIRFFVEMARESPEKMLLMLSDQVGIAPTHRRVKTQNGMVVGYEAPDDAPASFRYIDTGLRYYPRRIVEEICSEHVPLRKNHDTYLKGLVARGEYLRAYEYRGPWRHFAYARDFSK